MDFTASKKQLQSLYLRNVKSYDIYCGQDTFDYLDQSEDYAGSKERLEEVLRNDMGGYTLKTNSMSGLNAALYPDLRKEESSVYQILPIWQTPKQADILTGTGRGKLQKWR